MKNYVEAILHQEIKILPFEDTSQLPLAYRHGYQISSMMIADKKILLAEPLNVKDLATIKKQHKQLEAYTGTRCVLSLSNVSSYAKESLVREGIPFIWRGHQIYLPFLGILLDNSKVRLVPQCDKISFLTQKLVLTAIYQGWEQVTVSNAATLLGVTKTAVSRSFDELESLGLPYLSVRSRARKLTIPAEKRTVWEGIKENLRNPVIATYRLRERPIGKLIIAGLSALGDYSLLTPPACPVLAVCKKDLSGLKLTKKHIALVDEDPGCILHEIGYQIEFGTGEAIDPLSLALSLSEDEKDDPRVSMAVDEMLERYVW